MTNGYDHTAVLTALENRIGFRQPLGSGVPTLTSAVTTTNSGRYFQDFHALVTVQNIKQVVDQTGTISEANLITHMGDLRKAAILRALNGVFVKQILEQKKLFIRYGQNDDTITADGLFTGYEIDIADAPDAAVQLDALHLYFDAAATFNVYLFKDGELSPVSTIAVTTVANKVTEIIPSSDVVMSRGKYYLGYFQADTGAAKAYKEQVDHWNAGNIFRATPFTADATGATAFDRDERSYPAEPYGLNAEVSSFRNHTTQIKRKAAMFDELIGLMLAYDVIEKFIYTTRANAEERVIKNELDKVGIQLDLTGAAPISDSPQVMGLKQRIVRETNSVKQAFYPEFKSQVVSTC